MAKQETGERTSGTGTGRASAAAVEGAAAHTNGGGGSGVAAVEGKSLSLKVSLKGAVQLDGLRRFPTTLYADEWELVLQKGDAIRAFIAANRSRLKTKAEAGEGGGGGQAI